MPLSVIRQPNLRFRLICLLIIRECHILGPLLTKSVPFTMQEELRREAKKKVEAKMAFYTTAIVFAFTTVVLLMISFYLPGVAFWLRLPIPLFVMVLCILYLSAFGMPNSGAMSQDWQEEEIEREMARLYRQRKAEQPPLEDLSENDILELKELERLKKKWDWNEDYV